jgi:hypothetical protein
MHIGLEPAVFFSVPLKLGVAQGPHHAFLKRKMFLQQAEEFNHGKFRKQSIVLGRPACYGFDAVEYAFVLEIDRGYSDQVLVLPLKGFHASTAWKLRMDLLWHCAQSLQQATGV